MKPFDKVEKHAKKMKENFNKSHPPANIEDNPTIPIINVNKLKRHLKNNIGIIFLIINDEFYKTAIKHDVPQKFNRSPLTLMYVLDTFFWFCKSLVFYLNYFILFITKINYSI